MCSWHYCHFFFMEFREQGKAMRASNAGMRTQLLVFIDVNKVDHLERKLSFCIWCHSV